MAISRKRERMLIKEKKNMRGYISIRPEAVQQPRKMIERRENRKKKKKKEEKKKWRKQLQL